MPGVQQYTDDQIAFVLWYKVLEENNRPQTQEAYRIVFGLDLTETQVRYLCSKYELDPRFNAPKFYRSLPETDYWDARIAGWRASLDAAYSRGQPEYATRDAIANSSGGVATSQAATGDENAAVTRNQRTVKNELASRRNSAPSSRPTARSGTNFRRHGGRVARRPLAEQNTHPPLATASTFGSRSSTYNNDNEAIAGPNSRGIANQVHRATTNAGRNSGNAAGMRFAKENGPSSRNKDGTNTGSYTDALSNGTSAGVNMTANGNALPNTRGPSVFGLNGAVSFHDLRGIPRTIAKRPFGASSGIYANRIPWALPRGAVYQAVHAYPVASNSTPATVVTSTPNAVQQWYISFTEALSRGRLNGQVLPEAVDATAVANILSNHFAHEATEGEACVKTMIRSRRAEDNRLPTSREARGAEAAVDQLGGLHINHRTAANSLPQLNHAFEAPLQNPLTHTPAQPNAHVGHEDANDGPDLRFVDPALQYITASKLPDDEAQQLQEGIEAPANETIELDAVATHAEQVANTVTNSAHVAIAPCNVSQEQTTEIVHSTLRANMNEFSRESDNTTSPAAKRTRLG